MKRSWALVLFCSVVMVVTLGFTAGVALAAPQVLPPNDDGYSDAVDMGFTISFFGNEYSKVYVNNNGNVTFDSPLSEYTPSDLSSTNHVIVAPGGRMSIPARPGEARSRTTRSRTRVGGPSRSTGRTSATTHT